MKKQILLLVMIIAVTGVVSGCQKKISNNVNQQQNNNQTTKTTETPKTTEISNISSTTSSSVEEAENSDWLLYENSKYGFTLKYPKGISPEVYENGNRPSIYFNSNELYFDIRLVINDNENLSEFNYLDFSPVGKGSINNQEALIFKSEKGYCDGPACGYPFIGYTTKFNGNFYSLTFYKMTELNDDAKKVLESFKFIIK